MPAPTVLTHKDLLQALGPELVSPSTLAAKLGVSRATVHRKLAVLVTEGIVFQTGKGPSSAYRLKSPQEQFEEAQAPAKGERRVNVAMGEKTAATVQAALEFYARIGIGQFHELLDLARWGLLKRADSSEIPVERFDRAEELLAELKAVLLDLPANASFGIHGTQVHARAKQAWAVSRALRHRMAWDHSPEGGLGVHYDEPLPSENSSDVTVTSSHGGAAPVDISELPPGMLLQVRGNQYRVLGPTEDGEHLRVYAESHSIQTAIQMARNVADGKPSRRFNVI